MVLSEKKITRVTDFLVNKMGWHSKDIARYPTTMLFSLEKRIVPTLGFNNIATGGVFLGECFIVILLTWILCYSRTLDFSGYLWKEMTVNKVKV
ncbi:hypothetical protein RHGRI_035633 [Rhododendron griersonianum]|uniref:Uncharacterized protein n=1 Tax=Rhododendron griersonianum TaxID=479676 RepID=A0AAV6HKA5_9ERIC|nr:hypothetical protein RHGRI_035633 [Rhododendron griersonianum]